MTLRARVRKRCSLPPPRCLPAKLGRLMPDTRSPLFWFPEAQNRTGRINDYTELTRAHHLDFFIHYFSSKRLGLARRRFEVIDLHVGQPQGRCARYRLLQQSTSRPLTNLDHGVGVVTHWHVFELPIEQLPVKCLRLGNVRGVEFDVYKWISHQLAPFETVKGSATVG